VTPSEYISHLGCDFFDALIACLQKMYGVFHTQILKIGERRFAHDSFHSASQSSFARTSGFCGFIEGKPFGKSTSCPAFELLDHRVGMREVVAENIGGLRGSRIHDQILCRECGELRAFLPNERESQIHMTECRARGDKFSGLDDHSRFVETNPGIALPK
jgi:hypothetical protein